MQATPATFLDEALSELRKYKKMGEMAIAQVPESDLARPLDEEGNSIAVLVKHLRGNMRSRWRDFLTTDGEKPDRNRDSEFEIDEAISRDTLLEWWEHGWGEVFSAIEPLGPADLERMVTIRGEPHSVMQAIMRQLTHYAAHVGQIVLLAKHFRGTEWQTLSIPRKK